MKVISVFDPTAVDEKSRVRGIGRYLKTLQEAFRHLDTDPVEESPTGVSQYNTQSQNPGDNFFFQFTANINEIKKQSVFINPFFNPIQKPLKIRRLTQKQIAVIHDLVPFKYPHMFPTGLKGMIYTFLNKWALRNYDLIVTDSIASKRDILHFYKLPEKKVQVIYPTVSRMFTPHLDREKESVAHHHPFHSENDHSVAEFSKIPLQTLTQNPLIQNLKDFAIYVGDATWNKNLPNIAQAIKMANIPCVFVGKVFGESNTNKAHVKPHPWNKSLQQFLKLAEGDDRFIFPGYVSDTELMYLYKRAKVNILVSHDEGFGLSYIEAGFMSTPSILSDTPIFHEIAADAADFAPPNNPKEIAQKISTLFYDNLHQEKMSIKAFDRAQEFHPQRFQKEWVELLKIA
ncbi:MAG: glycosyltransferase family 1 protein [Candidatus Roizmanbacteria bacterium]|nr:glycosyltransferase family 1 protein [Candidatus Roizmanbacteria bacterium]